MIIFFSRWDFLLIVVLLYFYSLRDDVFVFTSDSNSLLIYSVCFGLFLSPHRSRFRCSFFLSRFWNKMWKIKKSLSIFVPTWQLGTPLRLSKLGSKPTKTHSPDSFVYDDVLACDARNTPHIRHLEGWESGAGTLSAPGHIRSTVRRPHQEHRQALTTTALEDTRFSGWWDPLLVLVLINGVLSSWCARTSPSDPSFRPGTGRDETGMRVPLGDGIWRVRF